MASALASAKVAPEQMMAADRAAQAHSSSLQLRCAGLQRQLERKDGTMADLAGHGDGGAVRLNNGFGDGEPHAVPCT